ncbi:PHA/PHB synthase family protein [Qipengyuania sp. DGS5-3]|uniref:PHA/PHB synthase family protein n=1 Tax=Qipengyuania sp. DGS5-3 TaxID=3349632 RepID=UPI0036D3C1D2
MSKNDKDMPENADLMSALMSGPGKLAETMFAPFAGAAAQGSNPPLPSLSPEDMQHWAKVATQLQGMWMQFQMEQAGKAGQKLAQPGKMPSPMLQPQDWQEMSETWFQQMPWANPAWQKQLLEDGLNLWKDVLGQFGMVPGSAEAKSEDEQGIALPLRDRRFADPKWSAHPVAALVHQTYLFLSQRLDQLADEMTGLSKPQKDQLRFLTKTITEAASPANFAAANPVVLQRTLESRGENLVKGMEHLLADLKEGQLTHTDRSAFKLGENIATTPGKVVHETDLFQLIQYSPTTDKVMETPLVIFPPWINRFYILDLNAKKSFVKWAVDQGITVFMVSWRSADSSMKDVIWDDYVRGQIEAIDHIRERLKVPSVHAIGYCVAGTTLAATLSLLKRRGEDDKVKSATFFTAQIDFKKAGELLNFIDDQQLATIKALSSDGYLDGRYMAAAFNMLRSKDLIWNYVVNNYMLGEDYPAFDLLHWNGDVTNLPAKWHQDYLRDLYRDNRLVQADSLSVDNTPIDVGIVDVPTYVQAGREDHIAPAQSVWKITEHFKGPIRFLLAGSGHIAGVVNPPSSGKYQYWINEGAIENGVKSLDEFVAGATEHPGSWWPDWLAWLNEQDPKQIAPKGKRKPGSKGDKVIEDAPGRYVMTR